MVKNYNQPVMVYVEIPFIGADGTIGAILKYAFGSKLKDSLMNDFGQTKITPSLVTDTFVQNLVVGCSNIKPYRAKILTNLGWDSGYISDAKIPTLLAAGYDIEAPEGIRFPGEGPNSDLKKVPLNAFDYCWSKAKEPDPQPDFTVIGVSDATINDSLIICGAEFPKPPEFWKYRGQGNSRMSTFGAKSKLGDAAVTAAGWSGRGGKYTARHFLEMFSDKLSADAPPPAP